MEPSANVKDLVNFKMKVASALYLIVVFATAKGQQIQLSNFSRNTNGPLSKTSGNIAVISAQPRNGTIIKQGDSVRLSCRTNIRWFFCVWKGPGDKKQCAIQERMPQNVCQGKKNLIEISQTSNLTKSGQIIESEAPKMDVVWEKFLFCTATTQISWNLNYFQVTIESLWRADPIIVTLSWGMSEKKISDRGCAW